MYYEVRNYYVKYTFVIIFYLTAVFIIIKKNLGI